MDKVSRERYERLTEFTGAKLEIVFLLIFICFYIYTTKIISTSAASVKH